MTTSILLIVQLHLLATVTCHSNVVNLIFTEANIFGIAIVLMVDGATQTLTHVNLSKWNPT